MSDEPRGEEIDGATAHGAEDEAMVAQLLAAAGRRPELPADELAQVRAMVRQAWQERAAAVETEVSEGPTATPASIDSPALAASTAPVAHSRWAQRRVVVLGLAMAAGLAIAIGLVWWRNVRPVRPQVLVARVETVKGDVQIGRAGEAWRALAGGDAVPAGSELRSGGATGGQGSFVSLRLAGGGSVRLDAGTRLRVLTAEKLALDEGAVYVDSGLAAESKVTVQTPLGDVRELGTQFTVRLADGARELRVRVREGAVAAATGGGSHTAHAGEELVVDRAGHAALRTAASSGEDWAWVLTAAPPFAGEGRTVAELLDWVSRETGWRLRYEGDAQHEAATAVLHGAAGAVPPDRAAFALLPGAGLEAELRDGTLIVRSAP